jgi:hypothetical protein
VYTPSTYDCGYSELDRLTGIPARNGLGWATVWSRFEAIIDNNGAMLCWRYKVSSTAEGHLGGRGEGVFVMKDCIITGTTHPQYRSDHGLKIAYVNSTTGVYKELG